MTIIEPNAISFTDVEGSLQLYLQSILEEDGSWADLFGSSTGQVIIRMLAGLTAYNIYRFEFTRRELAIDTAQMRSSLYQLAQFQGYPVNRRTPAIIRITGSYSGGQTYLDRYSAVGTIGTHEVSMLDAYTYSGSGDMVLTCVVGTWETSEAIAVAQTGVRNWASVHFKEGDFALPNLTDENGNAFLYLVMNPAYISSDPTILTENLEDFLSVSSLQSGVEKILVQTHHMGGVVFRFGDGENFGLRILPGDYQIKYVDSVGFIDGLAGLTFASSLSGFTPSQVEVVSHGSNEDSLEKLRTLIPLYYQTLRRAVTTQDHEVILEAFSGSLISAKASVGSIGLGQLCCTLYLAYLFLDEHLATSAVGGELDQMSAHMDVHRMIGFQLTFTDPEPIGIEAVMVVVVDNSFVSKAEVEVHIQDEMDLVCLELGATFHCAKLLKAANAVPGVSRTYIQRPLADRTLLYNQYFRRESLTLTFSHDPDHEADFENPDTSNDGYKTYTEAERTAIQSGYPR